MVSVDDVAHQIAFNGNDYGIDAYHFDRYARNLYLYQFKWSEDHNLFKDSMQRLAKHGIARIFNATTQDPLQNDVISYLKHDLREVRELIDRIYVHFVFKGNEAAVEKSEGLSNRREDIENKSRLISSYFGERSVDLAVEFISDKPGVALPPPKLSYEFILATQAS